MKLWNLSQFDVFTAEDGRQYTLLTPLDCEPFCTNYGNVLDDCDQVISMHGETEVVRVARHVRENL
jgi:hypothetical protein